MAKRSAAVRRQDLIDHLVGNCECGEDAPFTEDDLGTLNKLSDEQLQKLALNEDDEDEDDEDEDVDDLESDDEDDSDEDEEDEDDVTGNSSFDENNLPEEILEDLKFARSMRQSERNDLIGQIVANSASKKGGFLKSELAAMPTEALKKLVIHCGSAPKKTTPRLGGYSTTTTTNSARQHNPDDILELPTINFESASAD